jgi:S1-C subfamily serine protease
MSNIHLIICFLFYFTLPFSCALAQTETALQLFQKLQSSFVEIKTIDTHNFDKDGHTVVGTYQGTGSGVIIDSHGLIVTNTHVIANAPRILVGFADGKILEAKKVYSSNADFSFIKVDPPYPLTTITWADSAQAKPGSAIIAVGKIENNQHVLGGQITDLMPGMDSNEIELFELNINLEQGDSGGPILDNEGHLLGLIMAERLGEENKTYAIASNKIRKEYLDYAKNIV